MKEELMVSLGNMDESSDVSDEEISGSDDSGSEADSPEDGSGEEAEQESETEHGASKGHFPLSEQSLREWVEFNNKVTSMRSLFKRAKVQFINKTSRQIKRFRAKKGTPQQLEKNKQKADRLVTEISYLNELKKDVVPKFALLHSEQELTEIINSPESTLAYRVKAKIASMPVILEAARSYHAAHPDWRDSLFKLIQLSGKALKRKRRKMRGVKRKKQGAKPTPTNADVPEEPEGSRFHASNFPLPPPDEENSDASEENSVESLENETHEEELKDRAARKSSKQHPIPQKVPSSGQSTKKSKFPETPSAKMERTKNLKRSADDGDELRETSDESSQSESEPESDAEGHSPKNVDPFFITADNKEYKTHWRVESAADVHRANEAKKRKEKPILLTNLTPYDQIVKGGKAASKKPSGIQPKPKSSSKKVLPKDTTPKLESLHPSWQAKKKLNITAVPFQGKKVVFDD